MERFKLTPKKIILYDVIEVANDGIGKGALRFAAFRQNDWFEPLTVNN